MLAAAAWNFRKWMTLVTFFGFASSALSRPETSASPHKPSPEIFSGPTMVVSAQQNNARNPVKTLPSKGGAL
jgi:hypothetical protein